MGMMPAYFTTTNSKKRKVKRKPGWQQREAEHKAWLKKMGVDPDAKPKKREFVAYTPEPVYRRETPEVPSANSVPCGFAPKKESQKYTGDLIIGIGQMHKSNAVPIMRGTDQAEQIAKMRRG